MSKPVVDYSLYLVTDSGLNHPSRTLLQSVEDSILGGVTLVQLREKDLPTDAFIDLARKVHAITKKYNVPLLINDNIEVALAIDAEGAHVGQDDISCVKARQLLGPNKILGISTGTPEEAKKALADGADYIGIGTCFMTQTKSPKRTLGPIGVRTILEALPADHPLKTVVIGGIKDDNTRRVIIHSAGANGRILDGIAVVTGIVGAKDAKVASEKLHSEFKAGFDIATKKIKGDMTGRATVDSVLKSLPQLLTTLREKSPLTHHVSNYVVMNDTANATLALGGSPIMAPSAVEAEDLSNVVSSVVLNIGTLTESFVDCMYEAGKHANRQSKPVVFDPVGAGATTLRRETTRKILNAMHVDIIKGNAGEISTVASLIGCDTESIAMRGVDSLGNGFVNPAAVVQAVATRENCVVAMTGTIDYVSDGYRTVAIENGHAYQGRITGSGCMVASSIASFAAISPNDHFAAAVAGILALNLAGEHAAARSDVHGPGTFRAAFIDEIANLTPEQMLSEAKIKAI
ncbi:thiamine-phosphate diphosphorylase / hydroxyethylthiazole kinase [Entomortierella parvispora]|uniref:Thiamine-phosphate diphosphorylase / hydroxyethylthiazole kinase n=1 Tax=Entomortierella parvispora TaxID=205924 RepID=A0A9P3HFS2_9FUNG|nr:thiamine-phosphate diphosphorylase / hydroxyethylthiazole kinase [Entomortierella parvispora]